MKLSELMGALGDSSIDEDPEISLIQIPSVDGPIEYRPNDQSSRGDFGVGVSRMEDGIGILFVKGNRK